MATDRPTLESLAAELGVSRQTISNAINRPDRVAPTTLQRVLTTVLSSGYVPSQAARSLRTARTHALAMRLMPTFDGINGHILDVFLHELAEQARREGYSLALFAAVDEAEEQATYERLAAARAIDGVVLTATYLDDPRPGRLAEFGIPFVSFGRPWSITEDPADAPFDWVDVDGAAGTESATRCLAERGHRQIGYISWPLEPGVGEDRWEGWRRAMADVAPEVDCTQFAVHYPDGAREGSAAAEELIARGATAMVCASDTLALGAMRTLALHGGAADAVVGFDNTPVARELQMNSVAQPVAEAARIALSLLRSRLAGATEPRHVLLSPTPVLRDRDPSWLFEPQPKQR